MKLKLNNPPRVFTVGRNEKFDVKDCAHIELDANDQVTFVTESGSEYDVARKEWGFYATPSLNSRLPNFNLRAVLIKNIPSKKYYLILVERGKEKEFKSYMKVHEYIVVCWLDSDAELEKLEQKLKEAKE